MEARSCSNRSQPLWEPGGQGDIPNGPCVALSKTDMHPGQAVERWGFREGAPRRHFCPPPGFSTASGKMSENHRHAQNKRKLARGQTGFRSGLPSPAHPGKLYSTQQFPARALPPATRYSPRRTLDRLSCVLWGASGGGRVAEVSKLRGWRAGWKAGGPSPGRNIRPLVASLLR